MAVDIKFDVNRKVRVVNNPQGITIHRQCIVYGMTIAAGTSDPALVLQPILQLTGSPRFPQLGDLHPAFSKGVYVVEQQIEGIDGHTRAVDTTVIYRGSLDDGNIGGGGIAYTITHQYQNSSVQTGMTADGGTPIEVWYKPGESGVKLPPEGAIRFVTTVPQIKCSEILRASAQVTKEQWNTVKGDVRRLAGKVNQSPWGSYDIATWLFCGPSTRTLDSAGNSLFVQLDFAYDPRSWYRLAAYRNEFGRIPTDIDKESILLANGAPGDGGMAQANGITLASVQREGDFNIFNFTPDD